MSWVTIYNTFSPAEAQLIRSRLEAAGFDVNITGEMAALSVEGYSMATGGIGIQVPKDAIHSARDLILSRDNPEP